VTGAWAERMTFEAFLIFVTLWPIFVYYPLAHWIWNPGGFLSKMGVMDFAGGMTIHSSTGIAAIVVCLVLHKRKKHSHVSHHNIPLSAFGGMLVWAGWYSFNGNLDMYGYDCVTSRIIGSPLPILLTGGSANKANGQAVLALLNTHISACAGAAVWTFLAFRRDGKWHITEIIGGAFAGLAGVTPGSGFMPPFSAIIIGTIAGLASFYTVPFVKQTLQIDDVLDVFALQGTKNVTITRTAFV
jgi:Amt family ammonium transporter